MTDRQHALCKRIAAELDAGRCGSVHHAPSYRELMAPFHEAIWNARAKKTSMPDLGPRKNKKSSDPVLEEVDDTEEDVLDRLEEEDEENEDGDDDDDEDERTKNSYPD